MFVAVNINELEGINPRRTRAGAATPCRVCVTRPYMVSIRAAPARARRRGRDEAWAAKLDVSIRAAPARARRHERVRYRDLLAKFQSAPRPRGRGDNRQGAFRNIRGVSIRAAPARARRRRAERVSDVFQDVSIRAAPARARRLVSIRSVAPFCEFQSAPRPRGRGDFVRLAGSARSVGFNPRRARAGAATRHAARRRERHLVSIRAAPARARRHAGGNRLAITNAVSIRAAPARARRHSRLAGVNTISPGFNPRRARAGAATARACG